MHSVGDFDLENQFWFQEKVASGPDFVGPLAISLIVSRTQRP